MPTLTVALTGTGIETELSRAPTSLSFTQEIGAGPSEPQESVVTNTGTETVTLTAVAVGGTDAADFGQLTGEGTDCGPGTVLAPDATCKLRVRFDPTTTGDKDAEITVTAPGIDPLEVALDGTATLTLLTVDRTTIAFGPQDIDTPSAAETATVTNNGTEPVDAQHDHVPGRQPRRLRAAAQRRRPTARTPTMLSAGRRRASCACASTRRRRAASPRR